MTRFKQVNRITGWIVFLIASFVYLSTIEPTTSFWDCGEFIATAYKLEVGHPPGAPFFMVLARTFSLLTNDVTNVAMMVNAMSALASAFTILFLFWSITHLALKMVPGNRDQITTGNLIAVIGSGLVGALAFTFSDTFWFSAVEGEVYALSSLFTAIVFWAMLKWENIADQPHANRWIILIAYLMGLSIGVHLLNLLAIPAMVFIYYFRKYEPTRRGVLAALAVSVVLLGSIMYVIIPGVVKVASWFELLFVNGFGLPFKSGVIIYALLLIGLIVYGLVYTRRKQKVLANTIILAVTVILIGYSSFSMIVIRSLANPPMDENNPETVFSLQSYLNREQYGNRPLFKGQYYNAPVTNSEDPYTYRQEDGRYVKSYSLNPIYEYDSRFTTIFPRMYSPNPAHVEEYKKWADIEGRKVRITGQDGQPKIERVPTFGENLRFFISYQIGHMYVRYFMWNFAGKQNDIQSHGSLLEGNWLTGIKFFDEWRLGPQDNLPDKYKNHKARNTYFMLPLLLGLIGLIGQYKRDGNNFWVVMLLFVLTGLAIVVYLNQTPLQPRERDYAYAGSFYAFAIWIGLGVIALYQGLKRLAPATLSASLATLLSLIAVPGLMASENWDDHDRSERYVARDFARNYLETCAPNAILFTHGDNDTFPLWYAQEVEGIRTDVRVVNLSLLNTDWYIDQMKRKAYESEPVPFQMPFAKYEQGTNDVLYIFDRIDGYVKLDKIIDFIENDDPRTKLPISPSEKIDYIPSNKYRLTVDSATVVNNGTVAPELADKIVDQIEWTLDKNRVYKSEMMIMDLLANNNWQRPVYFVSTQDDSDIGLTDYLQLEGFAYRLVPIKSKSQDYLNEGRVHTERMYKNLMEKFTWGNMQDTGIWVDHTLDRTTRVIRIRNKFARLADALTEEGKRDSAIVVLDRCQELMPPQNYPYNLLALRMVSSYYKAGALEKANELALDIASDAEQELNYFASLPANMAPSIEYEQRVAMHKLYRLAEAARNNNQTEIAEKIDGMLNLSMGL